MDRLAVPVSGDDLLGPFTRRAPAGPSGPRSGPRNLDFTDGLNGWIVSGSSRAEVTGSHRDDYTVTAAAGTATLAAVVPHPTVTSSGPGIPRRRLPRHHGDPARRDPRQDVAGHGELSLYIVDTTRRPPPARRFQHPPGDPPRAARSTTARSPAARTGPATRSPRRYPPAPSGGVRPHPHRPRPDRTAQRDAHPRQLTTDPYRPGSSPCASVRRCSAMVSARRSGRSGSSTCASLASAG